MSANVMLTVTEGSLRGKQIVFHDHTLCSVGRSRDCFLPLPDETGHRTVSRHHCLFDIDPPDVRLRDLGSRNGTYVNGRSIGRRHDTEPPGEGLVADFPAYDLGDGDEVRVADTVFQVSVQKPPACLICGQAIPEDQQAKAAWTSDTYLCEGCRPKEEPPPETRPTNRKRIKLLSWLFGL
jgi:serine/threonine-protein kinase